jgi:cation transport ATPase
MADRYAGFFLPATILIAGVAWLVSGDPVRALVSGLSRAARAGVIVKGAGAIETLGNARTVMFDKTGTLTVGTPKVREIIVLGDVEADELLRLAASVDRLSAHVLGDALVAAATESGLALTVPIDVREQPGQGIQGTVDGHRTAVGSRAFMRSIDIHGVETASKMVARTHGSGEGHIVVAVDNDVAGRDRDGRRGSRRRRAHRRAPAFRGHPPRRDDLR